MKKGASIAWTVLLAGTLLWFPGGASGWGVGHRIITEAALAVQPDELRDRWSAVHRNAYLDREATILWYVAHRFNMHPDWVDGPSRKSDDVAERVRSTAFVYAERNGTFLPPITYAGPDRVQWEGPRPKTYHYFTLPTEELNREFARKGSRWYFERIASAFRDDDDVVAAEYFGAFAHAIQDRVSPYHVWDGYVDEREALEDSLADAGLQSPEASFRGKAASASLFWFVGGRGMEADLSGYTPQLLGETAAEASEAFVERLFQSREFAKRVYTSRDGFIAAHLQDDWKGKGSSEETDAFLSQVAEENARLTADALYTAFRLSLVSSD